MISFPHKVRLRTQISSSKTKRYFIKNKTNYECVTLSWKCYFFNQFYKQIVMELACLISTHIDEGLMMYSPGTWNIIGSKSIVYALYGAVGELLTSWGASKKETILLQIGAGWEIDADAAWKKAKKISCCNDIVVGKRKRKTRGKRRDASLL